MTSVASRLTLALCVTTFLAPCAISFAQEKISEAANEQARPEAANQQIEEESDLPKQRADWFYGQRAYPHSQVPAFARLRALDEREGMRAKAKAQLVKPDLSPTWSFDGPQPINTPYTDPVVSGRVTAFAVNLTNNNIVYAGTEGGVWKTTNGGSTWTPLTDTQASLSVGSIAIDPTNPNTVYIGTGEEDFAGGDYYGAGILKSTDGGSTWAHYCGPFCGPDTSASFYGGGARIGSLAISPGNNQVLLAGVFYSGVDGVYRSTNGGQTWTQTLAGNPASSVQFDPTNANVAWATLGDTFTGGTSGIYRSADGGLTWTATNGSGMNTIDTADAARIVLTMVPSNTSTLYASVASIVDGSLLGFYKTTDSGADWIQETNVPDYCTPQCSFDNAVAVQPTNANVIYAGGAYTTTIVRSLDGGVTWTTLQSAGDFGFLHADVHALVFSSDGTELFLGCDGGAYDTTQITADTPAFTALNSMGTALFYPGMSISNTSASVALGGTQDNGTLLYSGSQTWNDVECGDGAATAIDPSNANNMYVACSEIAIYKSTTGGVANSWTLSQSGIDTSDNVEFIPPLAIDPSNGSNLYFGTYRLYQTTNGASSWTAISPDLTTDNGFWSVVTSIAVAPTNSNTIYVGTGDPQVQVTKNAGLGVNSTWTNVSAGLPPRILTQVAVDPTVSTTAYATFSGFSGFGDSLGHVFKTTNGGTAWTDISGNLPNDPVNALVIVPDSPSTIFVGTDTGVYYTTNSGTSWTPLVDGLPTIPVMSLSIYNPGRLLRAGTFGRGAWDINFSTLLSSSTTVALSSTSLSFGYQDVGTQSASDYVTLTNTGSATLAIPSIAVTGTDASSFVFANSCGTSLAAGANCVIHGHFAPAATGALTAAVTLTDSATGSPQTISLSGTGVNPTTVSLSATSHSFGSQEVGTTSASEYVTLTNTGSATLGITSIAVTGTDASSFVFANSCGTSLAAGANCSIHGHFAPAAAGALTAAVTLTDSATGSPQTISLSGTGVNPTTVSLSSTSASFGYQQVGTTSASDYVTLTNTGGSTLAIASIALTGTGASSFVFANSCGTSLAAGANCVIHGHFAPAAAGALTAAITITDSATGSPQSISLSGTGVNSTTVSLSATSLVFGTQDVGTTSASQTVILTNTGTSTLAITSIVLTGTDASSFVFANSCGTSLAAGANCQIHGHFTPAATGALTAAITITDSATGSPQTINVSGTGH